MQPEGGATSDGLPIEVLALGAGRTTGSYVIGIGTLRVLVNCPSRHAAAIPSLDSPAPAADPDPGTTGAPARTTRPTVAPPRGAAGAEAFAGAIHALVLTRCPTETAAELLALRGDVPELAVYAPAPVRALTRLVLGSVAAQRAIGGGPEPLDTAAGQSGEPRASDASTTEEGPASLGSGHRGSGRAAAREAVRAIRQLPFGSRHVIASDDETVIGATLLPAGEELGAALLILEGESRDGRTARVVVTCGVAGEHAGILPSLDLETVGAWCAPHGAAGGGPRGMAGCAAVSDAASEGRSDTRRAPVCEVLVGDRVAAVAARGAARWERQLRLVRHVSETLQTGGKVAILAAAIGEAQEIIALLHHAMAGRSALLAFLSGGMDELAPLTALLQAMEADGRAADGWCPQHPIYVDGLARDAARVYQEFGDALAQSSDGEGVPDAAGVREALRDARPVRSVLERRLLGRTRGPLVVLMGTGLRGSGARELLAELALDPRNRIVLPGEAGRYERTGLEGLLALARASAPSGPRQEGDEATSGETRRAAGRMGRSGGRGHAGPAPHGPSAHEASVVRLGGRRLLVRSDVRWTPLGRRPDVRDLRALASACGARAILATSVDARTGQERHADTEGPAAERVPRAAADRVAADRAAADQAVEASAAGTAPVQVLRVGVPVRLMPRARGGRGEVVRAPTGMGTAALRALIGVDGAEARVPMTTTRFVAAAQRIGSTRGLAADEIAWLHLTTDREEAPSGLEVAITEAGLAAGARLVWEDRWQEGRRGAGSGPPRRVGLHGGDGTTGGVRPGTEGDESGRTVAGWGLGEDGRYVARDQVAAAERGGGLVGASRSAFRAGVQRARGDAAIGAHWARISVMGVEPGDLVLFMSGSEQGQFLGAAVVCEVKAFGYRAIAPSAADPRLGVNQIVARVGPWVSASGVPGMPAGVELALLERITRVLEEVPVTIPVAAPDDADGRERPGTAREGALGAAGDVIAEARPGAAPMAGQAWQEGLRAMAGDAFAVLLRGAVDRAVAEIARVGVGGPGGLWLDDGG